MKMYKNEKGWLIEEKDVEIPTFRDMLDAGFSSDDLGVEINDGVITCLDTGSNLENEEVEGFLMVQYSDGSNWKNEIIDEDLLSLVDVSSITEEENENPMFFLYEIDGEMYTQSNISGGLSPYYIPTEDF